MDRFLAQDTYAAFVGDHLVVLDVARDAYLCAPGAASGAKLGADGGSLSIRDPELAGELAAAGLVLTAPPAARVASRPCPRAARDLPRPSRSSLTARDALEACWATADAGMRYAGRPLSALLAAARREAGPPQADPEDAGLVESAQAFRRWVPFTPLPAKCLLRAFLLRTHLRRSGYAVRWVFGVRTWPFEAHCWIQVGDMVLDDSWERLAVFEPLLVV